MRPIYLLLVLIIAACQAAPVKDGVHVRKSVSVQLNPHRISHVDHFNPAGHVYAAHGEVDIRRKPTTSNISRPINPTKIGFSRPRSQTKVRVSKPRKSNTVSFFSKPVITTKKQVFSVPSKTFVTKKVSKSSQSNISKSFRPSPAVHKTVSIRQPTNVRSSINHFTPTGHIFVAIGSAKIGKNIVKNVSPRVTVRKQSNSFVVPGIQKVAKTEVNLKPIRKQTFKRISSPKISSFSSGSNSFPKTSSGINLERTVSVKSPQRIVSVIDHFNPAGHVYAATGNVKINRNVNNNIGSTFRQPQERKVVISKKPSVKVVKTTQRIVSPIKEKSFSSVSTKKKVNNFGSNLNLEKSVSVKSPQRKVNVIDHFNPAGHIYSATGNVRISSKPSVSQRPVKTNFKTKEPKFSVSKPKPEGEFINVPIVNFAQLSGPETSQKPIKSNSFSSGSVSIRNKNRPTLISSNRLSSGVNIEKSVSVKSPNVVLSVIDHFNPAQHQYAATGNVKINRQSFSAGQAPIISVSKPSSIKTAPVKKVHRVRIQNKPVSKKVSSGFSQSSVFIKNNKIVENKVNIPKSLTVVSNVNSGNRASLVIVSKQTNAAPKIRVIQPSRKLRPIINEIASLSKISSSSAARNKLSQANFTPSSGIFSINAGSSFSLEKSVSVQSPKFVSTVIDHFTPAQHQYSATGNVKINRQTVRQPSAQRVSIRQPTQRVSVKQPPPQRVSVKQPPPQKLSVRPPPPKKVSVKQRPPPQRVSVLKETKVFTVPSQQTISTSKLSSKVSSFNNNKVSSSAGSRFNLEKSVSVKSPQRVSSVISHFTPAGHQYAATGNVKINRVSSIKQEAPRVVVSTKAQTVSVPKISVVSINQDSVKEDQTILTNEFKTKKSFDKVPSKGSVSISSGSFGFINKSDKSGLTIEKSVSVKSPQTVVSVIDHFNPAGHNYAATGSVKINRQSTFGQSASSGSRFPSGTKKVVAEVAKVEVIEEEPVEVEIKEEKRTEDAELQEEEQENEEEEESSVFIQFRPYEGDSEDEEEDESEEDSDESGEYSAAASFFGAFTDRDNGYLPPANEFLSSYLPPSSDYIPPRIHFSTNDLPPIS